MYENVRGLSRSLAHSSGAMSEPGGGGTSAAGGAASPGHESFDSDDKMYLKSLDRTSKIVEEKRKSRTFMGSELLEYLTRQHQLSLAQVASLAVPIMGEPSRKAPPSFSWRLREFITLDLQMLSKHYPSFLCITPVVTAIWEVTTVVLL